MKKRLLISLAMLVTALTGLQAKSLSARFSSATFFAPGAGPYTETYFHVSGATAYYTRLANGNYQAAIEVSINYQHDGQIVYFDKYNLLSPEITDTVKGLHDFTDMKRVSLPNGTYTVEMNIRDKNDPSGKPYYIRKDLTISYFPNIIAISDIELVRSYTASAATGPLVKNGYEVVPLVDNFLSTNDNALKFYAEVYNTSSLFGTDPFLLSYQIETYEQHRVLDNFKRVSRQQSKPVNVLLAELDVTDLPSGNYNLTIDIRNKNNEVVASKDYFFQRSKVVPLAEDGSGSSFKDRNIANTFVASMTSKDTLLEHIRTLWPIASPNENNFAMNQIEMADLDLAQKFFYDFWQKRSPSNPEGAWLKYKAEVEKVNASFRAGNKKGYMTERGRVYLQYGPPNQIAKNYNEPDTYPYEIWQYDQLGTQSNKKFVFYCPEIAINDFRLLHSDAKGEIYDEQWQLILKKRTNVNSDFDNKSPSRTFGNQYDNLFNNPH